MELPAGSLVMVVHGPEVFDHGDAAWLSDRIPLKQMIVAGVMARTAAEESNLPVTFDSRPPSRVISALDTPLFLATRGKTAETGEIFGSMVASRLTGRGLVHVECSARIVYCWNRGDDELAGMLSRRLGFEKRAMQSGEPDPVETRLIRGCIPGEAVYVNGIVIGRATAGVVRIRSNDGVIEPVSGLRPKPHGLEKLSSMGRIDAGSAWCKSGPVRRASPRVAGGGAPSGRILVLDHCGHEIYRRLPADCCGVLAIGDDTTIVCGHICAHRGIPVFGVTDGDGDIIAPSAFAPGSLVVEVRNGRDDDMGLQIAGMVPAGPVCWKVWTGRILEHLGSSVRVIIDTRDA